MKAIFKIKGQIVKLYSKFYLNCFEEIKNYGQKVLNQYVEEKIYVLNLRLPDYLINLINSELESLELPKLRVVTAFKRKDCYTSSNEYKYIHIDSTGYDVATNASIIIPIEGCEDTHMYYFHAEYTKVPTIITEDRIPVYKLFWQTKPEIIDKVCISDGPVLATVNIPHDTDSKADGTYRCTLTLRLIGNPTFNTILEKLIKHGRVQL